MCVFFFFPGTGWHESGECLSHKGIRNVVAGWRGLFLGKGRFVNLSLFLWKHWSSLSVNMSHHICIIKKASGGNPLFLTDHMLNFTGCSCCLRSPFGIHSDGGSKPIGMEE